MSCDRCDRCDWYSLDVCGHRLCTRCNFNWISNFAMEAPRGFSGIGCPVKPCQKVLSRQDIRAIGGHTILNTLDKVAAETLAGAIKAGVAPCEFMRIYCAVQSLGAAYNDYTNKKVPKTYVFKKCIDWLVGKTPKPEITRQTLSSALQKLSEELRMFDRDIQLPYLVTVFLCLYREFRTVLTGLLRIDSIIDIAERSILYIKLFELLDILSSRNELLPLLYTQDAFDDFWDGQVHCGSPMGIFKNLYKQACFALKKDNNVDEVIAIIKKTFEDMEQRVNSWKNQIGMFKDHTRNPNIHNQPPNSTLAEDYVNAMRPLQFNEAQLLKTHYFRNIEVGAQSLPSRTRRIAKEIGGLTTQLPLNFRSSIHIRVDEQRADILRALIVGPCGTPYEDGIFLFDIFLGQSFPDKPPQVQFLTTGQGTVRFSPNLYESGKICLSLLGTWPGPSWKPSTSTVLQVLISLQSLVLVEEPFYNEPGYSRSITTWPRDSRIYNQKQRYNTLMYSMLSALRSPDPVFVDVIKTHFRMKKSTIMKTIDKWCSEEKHPNLDVAANFVKKELRYLKN